MDTKDTAKLRKRLDKERLERVLDVGLLSAYHQSRALVELLGLIDKPGVGRFSDAECTAIRAAHIAAVSAHAALNGVIIDTGNELGQEKLKSISE